MSRKTARRAAWGLLALVGLVVAPTLALASANGPSPVRNLAFGAVLILAFSSVGALVASRRPENPIGWLFVSGGLFLILGELALEYAVYALLMVPGTLPGGAWAGWFGGWARGVGWFLVVLLPLLLFPTGRLSSPRWRPVAWGAVAFMALFTLVVWLAPASEDPRLASVGNPLGLELGAMNAVREVQYVALLVLLLACGASVVARFRGSRGDERQQIKWFAYAVGVMVVLFASWFSLALMGLAAPNVLMWTVPLVGLPVAVGIAILRYRLFDIDLVINRTLVYAALTGALAAVYVGSVVALRYLLGAAGAGESPLAVVASTLVIAALFGPLRRRIQSFIDRAFYRRRYDAARTLRSLSSRLRSATDRDRLGEELVWVVGETFQPAHASLWLKPAGRPAGGRRGGDGR